MTHLKWFEVQYPRQQTALKDLIIKSLAYTYSKQNIKAAITAGHTTIALKLQNLNWFETMAKVSTNFGWQI